MRPMNALVPSVAVAAALACAFAACTGGDRNGEGSTQQAASHNQDNGEDKNPSCEDLGLGTTLAKHDSGGNGTVSLAGGGTATISNSDGTTFDWSSTVSIDIVLVKGGPTAKVYEYPGGAMGGTGLTAAINPNSDKPYGLSHIDFCRGKNGGSDGGSNGGSSGSSGSSSGSSGSSSGSSGKTW